MSQSNLFNPKSTYSLSANFKIILLTGLLVGSLDIITALTDYSITTGKNSEVVLRFIASRVFGKKAFTGGTSMVLAGLALHFLIAFSFTLFFFWLYPRLSLLSKNRILTAVIYGIFMWLVMNFIVLPISNTPNMPFNLKVVKPMLILIVMIGLPLSFIAYKNFSAKIKKEVLFSKENVQAEKLS